MKISSTTNYNYSNGIQNIPETNFKSVNTKLVKQAFNPAINKVGFSAKFANLLYKIKLPFMKEFTTGDEYLDNFIKTTSEPSAVHKNIHLHYYEDLKLVKKLHKELKNYPEILKQMYITKNVYGKTPIYEHNIEKLDFFHETYKDDKDFILKAHLIKNKKGKIKAHNSFTEELESINKAFDYDPKYLAQIYLTKAKNGKYPINYASSSGQEAILNIFKTMPEVYKILKGSLQ